MVHLGHSKSAVQKPQPHLTKRNGIRRYDSTIRVEWYNGYWLNQALEVLEACRLRRKTRVEQIRRACVYVRRQQQSESVRRQLTALSLARKKIERTDLCYKWIQKLRTNASCAPDQPDLYQEVRYYQHGLVPAAYDRYGAPNPAELYYGRRYADANVSLELHEMGLYHPADHGKKPFARPLSMQGAPKEVRRLLCGKWYHDCDMENCFCMIAVWLGEKYGLEMPVLKEYTSSKSARRVMLD